MAAQKKLSETKIEFIPQEDWEKTSLGRFLKWLLQVGRWIIIVTELVVILAFISRFKLDRDLTNLNEEIKQKQAIISSSSDFEKEFLFLQKRLSTIEGLRKNQVEINQIMDVFAQLTPIGVKLSNFSLAGEEINLTAVANSEFTFASFLKNLKNSPQLNNVAVFNVSIGGEYTSGINFNIKAELKT